MLLYDSRRQLFVEPYPDPRAGAPISDQIFKTPNLDAYMANLGNLGNPLHFRTAEVLMTTGLTAAGRDEHLQSPLVRYKGYCYKILYL